MTREVLRPIGALVVVILWTASLCLPYEGRHDGYVSSREIGYFLLLWGWLGPFGLNFGWYANILLLILCGRMMVSGKGFSVVTSVIMAVLAADGALPTIVISFGPRGTEPTFVTGPAVWVWLSTFLVALAVDRFAPRAAPQPS